MLVTVEWTRLIRYDRRFDSNRCLYAYQRPDSRFFLYIGKAYTTTISGRLTGSHKDALFARLFEKFGLRDISQLVVFQGRVKAETGRRVTKPVFRDVESLLIKRTRPSGNTNCKRSRIPRPGMIVQCVGDWPYARSVFREIKMVDVTVGPSFPTT